MENQEELNSLKEQVDIHKERLRHLELQKAKFGSLYVPAHITIEIEDEKKEIHRLTNEIERLKPEPQPDSTFERLKPEIQRQQNINISGSQGVTIIQAGGNVSQQRPSAKSDFGQHQYPHSFQNPFIKGPMITEPKDFFGRTNEIKIIFTLLQSMASCSVVSNRRMGKSSLLYYITLMCRERLGEDYRIVYVDLQSAQCHSLIGLITAIGEKLFSPSMLRQINPSNNLLVEFEKNIKELRSAGVRPVICLDEFENLTKRTAEFTDDFFESWRSLGGHGFLSFITASQSKLLNLCDDGKLTSPFYNIFSLLELGVFSDEESLEFVNKDRPEVKFTQEEKEAIIQMAKGHPLKLQIAAWHITQAKLEGKFDLQTALEKARTEMNSMIRASGR